MSKAQTLKGFRDVLPEEALMKARMLSTIAGVFQSFGFGPIETPHLEYTEGLIADAGAEIQKQLYRFEDQGGRDVCLRFDLTVPFARFVVQHKHELGLPFKRYAIGNVFRGEQPQFGRYREFTQCDFDIVGTDSIAADAEIVQVIGAVLDALAVGEFKIRANSRRIMNGFAAGLGLAGKESDFLRIIDKRDKIGFPAVAQQLAAEFGLTPEQLGEVEKFLELSGKGENLEILRAARGCGIAHAEFEAGVGDLTQLCDLLKDCGEIARRVKIDFSVARGLGYYTGIVYETQLESLPEIGSVCSGGRYDNLTLNFSKERIPGVGASVGLDRLLAALQKTGSAALRPAPAQILVAVLDVEGMPYGQGVAAALRAKGLAAEIYPEASKLKKQLAYADRRKMRFAVLIGADERAKGGAALKDLASGEQQFFASIESLAAHLQAAAQL